MAKTYIKPETKTYKVELQQIMLPVSGPDTVQGETNDPDDLLGKGFSFFEEEEMSEE